MKVIELSHPVDPRYLLVWEMPERVTVDDLAERRYGRPLLVAPMGHRPVVYAQPGGFGTDWVAPGAVTSVRRVG